MFLSWLDNRTLITCDCLLATAFALVFFGMQRLYPALRGINFIAVSFLLIVPGTFLVAARGSIPYFVSVMVANCFILASFIFLYRGILRFLGSRRSAILPYVASSVCMAILFYYTQIQDNIVPRVVAISVTIGLVRGLIALELLRKSPSFSSPKGMRLFAACMTLFAAVNLNFGIMTVLHGAPSNNLESSFVGTATLLVGVISLCATGLFILVLSGSELIDRSRDESQKDSLCAAFNRRGIEAKLATELKRMQRGKQKLCVALIDIDYFKSINDFQGHAAGDAALRDVAEAISTHLRGRDHLGRYGGDEFLLILPQTSCVAAMAVTERLNLAVSDLSVSGLSLPLTLSIGLTEAVPDDDAATLIARADKALYQAKDDGRNCRRMVAADADAADCAGTLDHAALGGMLLPAIKSTLVH